MNRGSLWAGDYREIMGTATDTEEEYRSFDGHEQGSAGMYAASVSGRIDDSNVVRLPCHRAGARSDGSGRPRQASGSEPLLLGAKGPVPRTTNVACFMLFILLCGGASALNAEPSGPYVLDEKQPLMVNKRAREIRILADLQPETFSGGWMKRTPGHHAVVWKGGKASGSAAMAAYVDDSTFHEAMVSIGAVPGNNLATAVWNERNNPASSAPDTRVEGTPVDVFVWWSGLRKPLPLAIMFQDSSGLGIDMRFGGNKAHIPEWRSGCIICMQSCPGGKISNRAYTMRDYVKNPDNFTVDWSHVPKGNRKALVIIRLKNGARTGH